MSVNSILNLMRELDLRGALAAFERFVSSPQELDAMPAQLLLETLLQNEVNNRLIRNMATTSCEDYHKRLFREYKDK